MLAISHSSVLPSIHWNSVSALISDHFHGSIPCLHVPLSTLHVQPCDYPRMTRGQVGYALPVRLLHSRLPAGLSWRTPISVQNPALDGRFCEVR